MDVLLPTLDKNAAYIWACYAIAALGVGGLIAVTYLQARKARKDLERAERLKRSDSNV